MMSAHNPRGKVKTMPRRGSQLMPVASTNLTKSGYGQSEENLGLYTNTEFTYAIGRHVIGNIGEVMTVDNERIIGVIKAISPDGDMGLAYAYSTQRSKNGQVGSNNRLIPLTNWKMVRITGIKSVDCVTNEVKTDAELAAECDPVRATTPDKELVPFFEPTEPLKDCSLDEGGFPADEMFKTNKELFSVPSTYNADLREYTTPVDRNAPNFSETEARCAKLAEDIERNQSPGAQLEGASDDEEQAFSAVARETKESTAVAMHRRRNRNRRQHLIVVRPDTVSSTSNEISRVSVSGSKPAESVRKPETEEVSTVTHDAEPNEQEVSSVKKVNEPEATDTSATTEVTKSNSTSEATVSTTSAPTTSVEAKVKKSTLDPNAPLFHPMGLQYATQPVAQPMPQSQSLPYSAAPPAVVSVSHPATLSVHTLPALIGAQQAPRYGAVNMPYVSHSNQIPHLVQNMVSGPMSANMHHQMRAGSLPPSLHQQGFPAAINPGANIFLQHPQQPGISIAQMTSQPMYATGPAHGNLFNTPTSNMGLARQRSNESSSTTHSNYGQPQPNVSMPNFQSPTVYQLSQPTNGFPLLLSSHPVGSHLLPTGVPAAGCSTALMTIPQTSGQQVYSGQTVITVPNPNEQAPPTSTPQQPTQQPFPPALGHFPDHAHQIQILQCAQGLMFASNQPNAGYYPAPAMLAAPGAINPAGMLPMVNQTASNAQPPPGAHQPGPVDPSMVNPQQLQGAQFPQINCQPQHLLPQLSAAQAQFMHAQQLNVGQHINPQTMPHSAYHAMAAIVGGSGSNPSQGH